MSRGIVDQITELLKDPVSQADLAKIEKIVREGDITVFIKVQVFLFRHPVAVGGFLMIEQAEWF